MRRCTRVDLFPHCIDAQPDNLLQFEKNVVPAVGIAVIVFEAPTAHTNQVNNSNVAGTIGLNFLFSLFCIFWENY